MIPDKQAKAFERVKTFRTELADYRAQFDRLRKEREEAVRLPAGRAPFLSRNSPLPAYAIHEVGCALLTDLATAIGHQP